MLKQKSVDNTTFDHDLSFDIKYKDDGKPEVILEAGDMVKGKIKIFSDHRENIFNGYCMVEAS